MLGRPQNFFYTIWLWNDTDVHTVLINDGATFQKFVKDQSPPPPACDAGVVGADQSGSSDQFSGADWWPNQVTQTSSEVVHRRPGVPVVQAHRHNVPTPHWRPRLTDSQPPEHEGVVFRRSRSHVLRLERLLHLGKMAKLNNQGLDSDGLLTF